VSRILMLIVLLTCGHARMVLGEGEAPESGSTPPCIACGAKVETIRDRLSKEQWAEVQRGEIITSKVDGTDAQGNKTSVVQSAAILRFPVAEVWSVVIDFESRPRFIPGVRAVNLIRREGNQLWLEEHLRVLLMNIDFRVINTVEPQIGRVTWRLDPDGDNDIADTTGFWQVVSIGERRTLVHYQAKVDSGQPVPGFIEDYFAERSLPKMVGGLREEIGRRYPQLRDADHPPDIVNDPRATDP